MLETLFDSIFVIVKKKVPVLVEHFVMELFVDVQHTCVGNLPDQLWVTVSKPPQKSV